MTVLGAHTWRSNSELMADIAQLGYLDGTVLDVTFGKGNWWKTFVPEPFIKHDLYTLDGVGWENLPELDESVDVVAFDPPYIAQGGRDTSTLTKTSGFIDAYGLRNVAKTCDLLHAHIMLGVKEAHRVLRPRGLLLLKCMNYVNSGRYRTAAYDLLQASCDEGFELVDEMIHLRRPMAQPPRPRQLHARRNYSILFVLRKVK